MYIYIARQYLESRRASAADIRAAYVSIRQNMSAYAFSASVCSRHPRRIRQHTSAYVSICQHTHTYIATIP